MSVLDRTAHDDTAIARRALMRTAQERLNRIEEIRDVAILADKGLSQRAIAERLGTTQPRIHRILRLLDLRADTNALEETPEEIVLNAFVACDHAGDTTSLRVTMIERLKKFTYTFGEGAPDGSDGYLPGTWDQLTAAYAEGLLSKGEYDEVRSAVRSR